MRSLVAGVAVLGVWLAACAPSVDLDARKDEIRALHAANIQAHLDGNVDLIVDGLAEGYLAVAGGKIERPDREEMRTQFKDYLENTHFSEYRDLQEPIVGISRDGSLAWAIVRVRVAGEREGEIGEPQEVDFVCAWLSLFERRDDGWVRIADISTFEE